jgi:multiple sugar transport system permease protein
MSNPAIQPIPTGTRSAIRGPARASRAARASRRLFIIGTLAPATLVLVALTLYPFFANIYYSLLKYDLIRPKSRPFVGLNNYLNLLTSPEFLEAAARTAYYVALAVGVELVLGLLIANALSHITVGSAVSRVILVLPIAATPVAVGLIWRLMYNPTGGLANHLLESVGLPASKWTAGMGTVIPSLALVDIWQWTPFVVLILLAGILALPDEPFEAARIDGASGLQTFWYLQLPMLRSLILIAVVFRVIDSLKAFDIIWVMTGGGPGQASTTLNVLAFRTAFEFLHIGSAAALAVIMLMLAILVTTTLLRIGQLQD